MTSSQALDGAAGRLAVRLCSDELRGRDPGLQDAAARRVFDTLGALAVGRRVVGAGSAPRSLARLPLDDIRQLCAIARCSEIDDIDALSLVTPGAVVVPVALVLADQLHADGTALLQAVTAGYEAMITVGEGLDGARLLARGIWPTYLLAPLSGAATAASLMGLDTMRTAEALALALARAAGVAGRPPREPSSRWWLCGSAAVDGVLAAEAAAGGLVGDPDLLERGLGADGALRFDCARLRPGDPVRLTLTETKPFCTARQALPAVQAALAMRDPLGGRHVESVEVAVPEAYRAMVDRPAPEDRVSSIQSVQFQVAAALSGDPALLDPVRKTPALTDSGTALMKTISVVADPDLSARYPAVWSARLTARLGTGEQLTQSVATVPGAQPQASWAEIANKYAGVGSEMRLGESVLRACQALVGSEVHGAAADLLRLVGITAPTHSTTAD